MVSAEFKQKVIEALKEAEKTSGLNGRGFATRIGINQAQWSTLKGGKYDGVIPDGKFISLGRSYNVAFGNELEWKTVKTATFDYIHTLLETCHTQSISTMLVDFADIGKSHTAKYYARNNRNAVYIDAAQVKTKQAFVRELARQCGVDSAGRYLDVYGDLIYYLNSQSSYLIIVDEAGDLSYEAFLELKALWNATEGNVGWFMTGADGLKKKFERSINCAKVGYAEIFRRYGSQYRKVTPSGKEPVEDFKRDQVAAVAKANAPEGTDIQKLVAASRLSLTNLYNMIKVMNAKRG